VTTPLTQARHLTEDEARIVLARHATGGGAFGERVTGGWLFSIPFQRRSRIAHLPWVVTDTGRASQMTATNTSPTTLIATIA
jgi:hypothetical protein